MMLQCNKCVLWAFWDNLIGDILILENNYTLVKWWRRLKIQTLILKINYIDKWINSFEVCTSMFSVLCNKPPLKRIGVTQTFSWIKNTNQYEDSLVIMKYCIDEENLVVLIRSINILHCSNRNQMNKLVILEIWTVLWK